MARHMRGDAPKVYRVRVVSKWAAEGDPDTFFGPYLYEHAARRHADDMRHAPHVAEALVEASPLVWGPAS